MPSSGSRLLNGSAAAELGAGRVRLLAKNQLTPTPPPEQQTFGVWFTNARDGSTVGRQLALRPGFSAQARMPSTARFALRGGGRGHRRPRTRSAALGNECGNPTHEIGRHPRALGQLSCVLLAFSTSSRPRRHPREDHPHGAPSRLGRSRSGVQRRDERGAASCGHRTPDAERVAHSLLTSAPNKR
jgi:hypothetical protein